MNSAQRPKTRREFLVGGAAAGFSLTARPWFAHSAPTKKKPRVAAVFTVLRFRSHAYNILENFFRPYLFCGELVDPGCEIVSFYADQFPDDDMTRDVSQRFQVPLYQTIDEALCVGGQELAVDAVLIIGEHGDYPRNELSQVMYPRKRFFDQSVAAMRRAGRYVPVFNDKHLSYRWDWAKEMYDTSRKHGFPLLAGSSVPLAERRPNWDLPAGAKIEAAVAVHGGPLEIYGFHGLELLQSFVEARAGGETGIRQIEVVRGQHLAAAADQGRWSRKLLEAAMQAERESHAARRARPRLPESSAAPKTQAPPDNTQFDHAILVTYRDGFQAAVVRYEQNHARWNFACQLTGESQPRATSLFNGPWDNRCLFKALSHAIQSMFVTGREPYPVERTLLTTGAIEAAMQSFVSGKPVSTPHLQIAYQPNDWRAMREDGRSWERLTAETPEPVEFSPGDERR